mmetsp:Transcript_21803/g.30493  ORF Transcript_21803/g.30493 Transcript_21803/m.30493 type:complete len:105 (-) Transcript_21803:70-384(-)|eukprot:CAMPEP_0168559652 /NCGR_PEP_ID=MMETSP0413-20121227/10639_1 /TAXON_ID=136452 /ORGANISM="Filamoeba nolandi, Strain NC-AS-23-1" /LENGTH=104 /DNA_ID=CAMNT_0008590897 /DNA_START=38 /DNA_END=352 /DNA_ORIENTATION=+
MPKRKEQDTKLVAEANRFIEKNGGVGKKTKRKAAQKANQLNHKVFESTVPTKKAGTKKAKSKAKTESPKKAASPKKGKGKKTEEKKEENKEEEKKEEKKEDAKN